MSRTPMRSVLSAFLILTFHLTLFNLYPARASDSKTLLDFHDDHLKQITRYLSHKDVLALSLVSKKAQIFKLLFIAYAIRPSEIPQNIEEKDMLSSFKASPREAPSDTAQVIDLCAKLLAACKNLLLSDQLSSQHSSLMIAGHPSLHIDHAVALKNFFQRDKYGGLKKRNSHSGNHSTNPLGEVYVKADICTHVYHPFRVVYNTMYKAIIIMST